MSASYLVRHDTLQQIFPMGLIWVHVKSRLAVQSLLPMYLLKLISFGRINVLLSYLRLMIGLKLWWRSIADRAYVHLLGILVGRVTVYIHNTSMEGMLRIKAKKMSRSRSLTSHLARVTIYPSCFRLRPRISLRLF